MHRLNLDASGSGKSPVQASESQSQAKTFQEAQARGSGVGLIVGRFPGTPSTLFKLPSLPGMREYLIAGFKDQFRF